MATLAHVLRVAPEVLRRPCVHERISEELIATRSRSEERVINLEEPQNSVIVARRQKKDIISHYTTTSFHHIADLRAP